MDDTLLPPSPNWFQVSVLAVSNDGWMVYGGPTKSLCALQPLSAEDKTLIEGKRYKAHVLNRACGERIISVDISPEWPQTRTVLTGSASGAVKLWSLEPLLESKTFKLLLSHDVHRSDKEEIAGVGFSNETTAITVGGNGSIVKWNLVSNIVKTFHHIRQFRPICMSCSPHLPLHVAVGTKQGVVILLDLNGPGRIVYKVRGQDDEITNLSWCPKYDLSLKKTLNESEKRLSLKSRVLENESVNELEASGVGKNLPDDSFDESAATQEDELFDIYKDHEADEFGHKKYQPEDIYVKVASEDKEDDYLAECMKLKEEILKNKAESETAIQSLVDAIENTHVDSEKASTLTDTAQPDGSTSDKPGDNTEESDVDKKKTAKKTIEASEHVHKHLLATIGKHGSIRVWSKAGKLVGSCVVPSFPSKNQKVKLLPSYPTLLWYKPDLLIIADGKNQLLQCDPLKIDCKNKLDWGLVHGYHKRSIYSLSSNAPRVQTGSESDVDWVVYTNSQDRYIIQYSMHSKQKVAQHATSGGFVYTVASCPYDASKVAISIGDGCVRIWETSTLENDDMKLSPGHVSTYWQNVQGKVLTVAWHPTRENLVAFGTAESRIGLLDTSGKCEKAARTFIPALSGAIYSISWGEGNDLYACAGGDLIIYHANKPDEAPSPMSVVVEGKQMEVSFVRWLPHAMVCGSNTGCVAVLSPRAPYDVQAAHLAFSKMIHTVDWHPHQTSNSSEDSPYKNLIAVCSVEKHGKIVILEYTDKEDGSKQLQTYKTLEGHKMPVLQIMWNPHVEARLLSTCQDGTVRVWDVVTATCVSIFEGHTANTLGACWSAFPQLPTLVMSGGGDCTLRVWDAADYPAEEYKGHNLELIPKKINNKSSKNKKEKLKVALPEEEESTMTQVATRLTNRTNVPKGPKRFLLPILNKTLTPECELNIAKALFKEYLEKIPDAELDLNPEDEAQNDMEMIKIFGTVKDVNDLLDEQMECHLKTNHFESWIMLAVFRGHIDDMMQFASQRDILCPYLLSLAPCVSLKYWKDATQLYLAQIDRLVAKGEEHKLSENKNYGGYVFRKTATQLGAHDVKAAVQTLVDARLFQEAYILCRIRYMDSIAQETLWKWARDNLHDGLYIRAAICYVALGEIAQASAMLGKMNDEGSLNLAASMAKVVGQNLLADHIAEKRENIKSTAETEDTEEILEQLPSRIELLMKKSDNEINGGPKINGDSNVTNGHCSGLNGGAVANGHSAVANGGAYVANGDGAVASASQETKE
ncbi:gem-associated protein 5-like [Ostrinia nubilalis]|uniref:gem-associated protein 5-like n=1 Tax=Ostrinia nubilalis TaxID=29057 RepID=UPI0030822C05